MHTQPTPHTPEELALIAEELNARETMAWATAEDARLMDEALARAVALGRPFEEQEVFKPAWELGYELFPALDQSRFQLYQEGRWKGKGEEKQFIPRLWVVSDEVAHIEDDIRTGAFGMEEEIVSRQLSTLTTAQLDRNSGELKIGSADIGMHVLTAEEAEELLQFLYDERDTLSALTGR